jgi:hypothetical protein
MNLSSDWIDSLLHSTLLLSLGLGTVSWLMRRRSAALRYSVLTSTLMVLPLLPFASAWMPGWGALKSPAQEVSLTLPSAWSVRVTTGDEAPSLQSPPALELPKKPSHYGLQEVWLGGAFIGLLWMAAGMWRMTRFLLPDSVLRIQFKKVFKMSVW